MTVATPAETMAADAQAAAAERTLPQSDKLPYALYRSAQVRELDRIAIEECGIPARELMERAGRAAYSRLRQSWPSAGRILIVCGPGNNAGDGFVVARLARRDGFSVRVVQLGQVGRMPPTALAAGTAYLDGGGELLHFDGSLPRDVDVIVDALLGIGLEREVTGDWAQCITAMNQHFAPILALDIPSGLHADSGVIMGTAVQAAQTVSFIALKQGMFTGDGPDCCGEIHFASLEVPARIYAREILAARRLDWPKFERFLGRRRRSAHKGQFGHCLLIGGDLGYQGAIRLAGEAALRTGAGLVTLATRDAHAGLIAAARPELMCVGVDDPARLDPLLARASVVAIGPGLGLTRWAQALLRKAFDAGRPIVADADALNLLAARPEQRSDWVLTPHPGEAARMLRCDIAAIQRNRFAAARRLQERFGGVCVLKGAGSIVQGAPDRPVGVCSDGNPGMATGGVGDLLTGVIAALIAQGLDPGDAAEAGVALHAASGDRAAAIGGERGLIASDLLPWLRRLTNPRE